jgi:hypothetical protein
VDPLLLPKALLRNGFQERRYIWSTVSNERYEEVYLSSGKTDWRVI